MLAYDASQTAKLLQVEGKRIHIPVPLAVMCGLKPGDIAALRWNHIDWAGARAAIIESVEQTVEGVHYKEPKSGRSRAVDLSPSVILKAHRARQAEGLLAIGIRSAEDMFIVSDHEGAPAAGTDRRMATLAGRAGPPAHPFP